MTLSLKYTYQSSKPKGSLIFLIFFLAHLKGGVMSSCSSVCVSSVVCPSCVRQQLVYTFFVGSYLFNALTYQVHIWCEDSLGQQLQIAYMYIGVRGQSQRSNRLFLTKYVTFPPALIFMCPQHLNGLSYPIHICFAYNLGPSLHIRYIYHGQMSRSKVIQLFYFHESISSQWSIISNSYFQCIYLRLGQQIHIACMYVEVKSQGQRSNSFYLARCFTFCLCLVFSCTHIISMAYI